MRYHGPRNYYVINSHGNNSCNCNCNLATKITLETVIYVILIDTFSMKTEALAIIISLDNYLCNCNWNQSRK